MPQLNPSPWFNTMLYTWFVFAVIIPPKIMSNIFPNQPQGYPSKTPKMTTWTWSWY